MLFATFQKCEAWPHSVVTHQVLFRGGTSPIDDLRDQFERAWLSPRFAKACPHSSSVIAFTLRVGTPCTYISTEADTSAFSLR
jgi:hypothetical protein